MAYVETSTPGGGSRRAYPSFFHGDSGGPNRDQSLEVSPTHHVGVHMWGYSLQPIHRVVSIACGVLHSTYSNVYQCSRRLRRLPLVPCACMHMDPPDACMPQGPPAGVQ
jgi:hypothetical protein